jgi:SAM-dependent methyltransferase
MSAMMKRFSKPSGATLARQKDFLQRNDVLNSQSREAAQRLAQAPLRSRCPLCVEPVPETDRFIHRGTPYFQCVVCGHIASLNDSERVGQDRDQYAQVYPRLSPEECRTRMEEIYHPKLEWILEACAGQLGLTRAEMLSRSWLEIGCGEGLFLKALDESGATRFQGLGVDEHMLSRSRELLGEGRVHALDGPLGQTLLAHGPQVVVAWFVLEHIFDLHGLADALKALPAGTLLCFSVPVFGLSTMLEAACDALYPRTLDSRVHTQLFTDESIDYFLARSGFAKAAEWVFGQDVADLGRLLSLPHSAGAAPPCIERARESFLRAGDELQQVVDRHMLADSRHVMAIKSPTTD